MPGLTEEDESNLVLIFFTYDANEYGLVQMNIDGIQCLKKKADAKKSFTLFRRCPVLPNPVSVPTDLLYNSINTDQYKALNVIVTFNCG